MQRAAFGHMNFSRLVQLPVIGPCVYAETKQTNFLILAIKKHI